MNYATLLKNTNTIEKSLAKHVLVDFFGITMEKIICNEEITIDLGTYQKVIDRLTKGEPYQYIKGTAPFYGRDFYVTPDVLIPRFETEGLIDAVMDYQKRKNIPLEILDLCTGSGILAITLSKEYTISVDASDISKKALSIASKNAQFHKAPIHFIESDLFEKITKQYHIIISNPPYVLENEDLSPTVKDYEPHLALYGGKDGLDYYRTIFKEVPKYQKKPFLLALEIGMTQGEALKILAKSTFPNAEIVIKKDLNGRNRYLFVFDE